MNLEDLNKHYDKLQKTYGEKTLSSIYNGGCINNPDICFIFMNPTGRNIASYKEWNGIKSPWIGTKNIWKMFYRLNLLDENIYNDIQNRKAKEWDELFAYNVYENVKKHKYFITNLAKCTQIDARPLPDSVYEEYVELLKQEIEIINPKKIIIFGNQISSILLNEKINVSKVRNKEFKLKTNNNEYKIYSTYYPIGNGMRNLDSVIEDLKKIIV